MRKNKFLALLSPLAIALASCGSAPAGDNSDPDANVSGDASSAGDNIVGKVEPVGKPFTTQRIASFDEPWAMDYAPGTNVLFVTEKRGSIKFVRPDGTIGTVTGVPNVAYGGQGGLGDIVFAPDRQDTIGGQIVYLSWAEAGDGNTRGAAVGRAQLTCETEASCRLENLNVIWRQQPKVTGNGHYSHRIAISPDGEYLFIASGDRQKLEPAQDLSNTLGTIVRLTRNGKPAPGNPFAERGSPTDEIWSYGHRNILGMKFDEQGRLWALEHGPQGGDELNLVEKGKNYGWPMVSNGIHYDDRPIPNHSAMPEFQKPTISWTPVIAPGDMIHYTADTFSEWQGQFVIAGMLPTVLVRVAVDGEGAREVARYQMEHRLRSIEQGPDGAILLLEDGRNVDNPALLRLIPAE